MDKRESAIQDLSDMFRGVPPRNILISFEDKPARMMEEILKEQQATLRQKKRKGKERER